MTRKDFLVCLLGILTCLASSIVGREAIVGGEIAKIQDFPYQVALFSGDDQCGGGIIGESHILTAAHCVMGSNGQFNQGPVVVVAQVDNLEELEHIVRVKVKKIYVPEEFKIKIETTTGDIAILKLEHPLDFKKHKLLKSLELPTRGVKHYVGKTGKIAGFGWNWIKLQKNEQGIVIDRHGANDKLLLRSADAHVLNDRDCQEGYEYKKITFKKEFCARVKQPIHGNAAGTCLGDSGSPLVLDGKTVIGVLSEGSTTCTEEVVGAIYTRVVHYLTFIENAVQDKQRDDILTHVIHE